MDGIIKAEWDPLKKVVVHKPGIEMFFGLLEPYGSLYERAFSRDGARNEHDIFTRILEKDFGVSVINMKDKIIESAKNSPLIKQKLVDLARETLEYEGDEEYIRWAKKEFEKNIPYYDILFFFYILLLRPKIQVDKKSGSRNISLNIIQRQPLANLYFMRDQQFVTDNGIVLCRLAKPSRRHETTITRFFWEDVLGIPILHKITDPGTIEGGEFIPMGKFALIGIGDRTNQEAIDQLLQLNFNYEEIGIVHQPLHPLIDSSKPDPMINMHLDTYFNVASKDVVVGSKLLLQHAKVEIYHNKGGSFEKDPKDTTLLDYVTKKGFSLIDITTLEQMSYASNFLCIKDKQILAIEIEPITTKVLNNLRSSTQKNPQYAKLLAQAEKDMEHMRKEGQFFPHKREIYQHNIEVRPIHLDNLTGGYGGAHCMTCALNRTY